jgi:hypothetical protein
LHIPNWIKQIEEKLQVQSIEPSQPNLKLEDALFMDLEEWLMTDKMIRKHKFRELWLKEEDNLKNNFNHITQRRRNCIEVVKNDNGQWLRDGPYKVNYFIQQLASKPDFN